MVENWAHFSFNKGQKIDFSKFDGVSKDELISRNDISDSQKNLMKSIFAKYDNGDGVLTAEEFKKLQADLVNYAGDNNLGKRELKKFNQNALGVDQKAYSMEDLQTVVGMMTDGSDSITNVARNGKNVVITYKPQEGVGTKTSTFASGDNNNLTILSDDFVNNGVSTHIDYLDGDVNKRTEMTETQGNSVTTTLYKEDGASIRFKTRVTGAVIEELDFENGDRVKAKIIDKGSDNVETTVYHYHGSGSTELTYDIINGNKPIKIVEKDKDGNVQSMTRKIEAGENWYNIVQSEYSVTDHKTTMEIVRQLKNNAKISRSSTAMPKNVTLPAQITLANGKKISLGTQNAVTTPADLIRDEIPQNLPAMPTEITIPKFNVRPDMAKFSIKQEDGRYFEYDANGRVSRIFDNKEAERADNNAVLISYDDNGNISEYQMNTFDNEGHQTGCIKYDGSGKFLEQNFIK